MTTAGPIRNRRVWTGLALLGLLVSLFAPGGTIQPAAFRFEVPEMTAEQLAEYPPGEGLRAIWISRPAQEPIGVAFDRLVAAKFNMVIYYAGCGQARYQSELLPWSSSVTADFDPLAEAVREAHARNLRIQAWWCIGETEMNTAFRTRYPQWDIALVDGIPDSFHWFNFSLPEARQFVGDVVLEIAQNYDVDGVHLDYVRYPAPPPYTKVDARKFFGPDDVPATVRDTYQRLKALRPEVELTAAVIEGQGGSANHLQNWHRWLAGNYIDRVMPMAYHHPSENGVLSQRVREWNTLPHADRVVPGLSVRHSVNLGKTDPKTPQQMMTQIALARRDGFEDFAIFSYETINPEILQALVNF